MNANKRRVLQTVLMLFLGGMCLMQARAQEQNSLTARPEDMAWWREARFGLFVHWGPVSLKGTEIGWSRDGERRGTGGGPGSIPVDVYDNLYKEFNPVKFDAKEWVDIAKAAGMRYLVFTSKHHDGFSMFDSKLTDYKITNSPFGRDVVAELSKACHDAGLRLGFYYSPPDWHHPDYRAANHAKYVAYLHGQIRELCSNYGQLDILWFDGLGGKAEDWDAPALFKVVRALQPRILINNRVGLSADFDTPEQTVGSFQNDRPWESCITICQQWAWKPDDQLKSLKECIGILVGCAGGDGNLLLNVGPMPTGEIEPRQVERLKEIGAWLRQYGETIYGTRGGPFKPGAWGGSTYKGNAVYVHVLNSEGRKLVLPGIEKKIVSSKVLTGGRVRVKQRAQSITIRFPKRNPKNIDTIVELTLNGPASEIRPRSIAGMLAADRPARASNIFQGMSQYGPDKAFDDNTSTRWATDSGTRQAWLEVDLGKPMVFDRVLIDEACGTRVQSFEIQSREGETWKTFFKGTTIGPNGALKFEPVTAQHVRLSILDATEGPTITEFQLHAPKK